MNDRRKTSVEDVAHYTKLNICICLKIESTALQWWPFLSLTEGGAETIWIFVIFSCIYTVAVLPLTYRTLPNTSPSLVLSDLLITALILIASLFLLSSPSSSPVLFFFFKLLLFCFPPSPCLPARQLCLFFFPSRNLICWCCLSFTMILNEHECTHDELKAVTWKDNYYSWVVSRWWTAGWFKKIRNSKQFGFCNHFQLWSLKKAISTVLQCNYRWATN